MQAEGTVSAKALRQGGAERKPWISGRKTGWDLGLEGTLQMPGTPWQRDWLSTELCPRLAALGNVRLKQVT